MRSVCGLSAQREGISDAIPGVRRQGRIHRALSDAPQASWATSPRRRRVVESDEHVSEESGRQLVGYWRRHPRKDMERVLREFDARGWRIVDPPKYYKVLCPCGDHMRWIHLTPSNPYYGSQALQWARSTCPLWNSEGR